MEKEINIYILSTIKKGMVLENVSHYNILGFPIILYLGILTLISLLITAGIQISNKKGWIKIHFKWHYRMAIVSITLALIHGLLAFLA